MLLRSRLHVCQWAQVVLATMAPFNMKMILGSFCAQSYRALVPGAGAPMHPGAGAPIALVRKSSFSMAQGLRETGFWSTKHNAVFIHCLIKQLRTKHTSRNCAQYGVLSNGDVYYIVYEMDNLLFRICKKISHCAVIQLYQIFWSSPFFYFFFEILSPAKS